MQGLGNLEDGLRRLFDDTSLRTALGREGRRWVEETHNGEGFLHAFDRVCARAGVARTEPTQPAAPARSIDEARRMSLTVIVTNYLRAANVTRLIDAIRAQTLQATIFVWDNSPAQDFDDPRVDWLIRSSRNARCAARWWMASHAETDFVLIHDDDLMPSNPNVFAWTVDAAARSAPFAVGASGVVLDRDLGYWQSRHVGVRAASIRRDVQVDIVKGLYSAVRRPSLRRSDTSIWMGKTTLRCRRGLEPARCVLISCWPGSDSNVALLPEGGARSHRDGHRAARELALQRFFRA